MLALCDGGITSSCGTSVWSLIALYSEEKMYSETENQMAYKICIIYPLHFVNYFHGFVLRLLP